MILRMTDNMDSVWYLYLSLMLVIFPYITDLHVLVY